MMGRNSSSNNKSRRNDWNGKLPFGKHHSNNCCLQESLRGTKISGWVDAEKRGTYILSKDLRTRHLLITKGRIVTFHWRDGVFKVHHWWRDIPKSCASLIGDGLRGAWHPFYSNTANFSYLNLVMRERQTNSKWGTFLQDNWSVVFQRVRVKKDEERTRKCPRVDS